MYPKENPILNLSLEFALIIIEFTAEMKSQKHYEIARQLLRSGTSIGANISEAQQAESRADFRHKIRLASKEASETNYWLTLCALSAVLPTPTQEIQQKMTSIQKLLTAISKKLDHKHT